MQTMKRISFAVCFLGGMMASTAQASVIWGTSASFGNVNLEAFDISSGVATLQDQFLVPNPTARGDNGRGVALLGDTIYYTTANSGKIYVTNANTHADLGVLVDTGFNGIANVATDGTFIYANNYQDSSGIINKYNTSGTLISTVTVKPGISGRDGFEVQNNPNINGGALTYISNRGDLTGPYDVYDSLGKLLISAFIDPATDGLTNSVTGIAYDGTDYFVSDINNNQLFQYSGAGNYLQTIDLSGITNPFTARLLEDLSAVGNTVDNPPPGGGGTGTVHEPATLVLMGFGLVALGIARSKRKLA